MIFYCLNCLHSFATEKKRESHKKVYENEEQCQVVMPSEDTKILEFNQYQKNDKSPLIIYAVLECLIEKNDGCKNNSGNSPRTKVSEHILTGFSMSIISSFKSIEKKHEVINKRTAEIISKC